MSTLTHLTEDGRATMVDVGDKAATKRVARAQAIVRVKAETLALIQAGDLPKGDVVSVCRIAGIQAAKKTADLIPLCHPLALSFVDIDIALEPGSSRVVITSECRLTGKTGVEMEALTAASVAALTLYDMVKAVDREATIEQIAVLHKSGGRHGEWSRNEAATP